MSHFRPLVSAAAIAALLTANAQAAVLSNLEGIVSVNSGNGFVPASIGSALAPGDRVRTGEGAVTIVYDNGCSRALGPHQVAIVQSTPPACGAAVGGLKDGAALAPVEAEVNPLPAAGLFAAGGVLVGVFATHMHPPSQVSP